MEITGPGRCRPRTGRRQCRRVVLATRRGTSLGSAAIARDLGAPSTDASGSRRSRETGPRSQQRTIRSAARRRWLSDEVLGRPLLGAVQQDDVPRLLEADLSRYGAQSVALRIWMRHASGEWTRLCCVLTSLAGATGRGFILLSDPEPHTDDIAKASELERHLWRIAAEVEASGILQRVRTVADFARVPRVGRPEERGRKY